MNANLVYTMTKWGRKEKAEIFDNGFTRFVFDDSVLPMCSMDNINSTYARSYLEFRGWFVTGPALVLVSEGNNG